MAARLGKSYPLNDPFVGAQHRCAPARHICKIRASSSEISRVSCTRPLAQLCKKFTLARSNLGSKSETEVTPMRIPRPKWISRLASFTVATTMALLTTGVLYAAAHTRRGPQDKDSARPTAAGDQSTSLSDQTDLAVTVYNSNIALVRDVRQLTLPTGDFRLKFMDIAATVNPATVHFRSLTEPEKLNVLEQNYEYDLLEPAKLLHKYVGKQITLE